MQSLVERQAEDAVFLWRLRRHQLIAPNVRLANLVRFDERLAAHLDALIVADSVGGLHACQQQETDPSGGIFLAVTLALARQGAISRRNLDVKPPMAYLPSSDAAEGKSAIDTFVGALALAERSSVLRTIGDFRSEPNPFARAIAVAALGALRIDPGSALAPTLSDPSVIVRARACRTVGQLGRKDLMPQLAPCLTEPDPECRFWAAWASGRMGAGGEALNILAEAAYSKHVRAANALDLLLRRLEVRHANAWLCEFAKLPARKRDTVRAAGIIGDPIYVRWLIELMAEPEVARLAGEAFSMITGLDLAYCDLDRKPPQDFESGPNDEPNDENVALDEDEHLPWPDHDRINSWWHDNQGYYRRETAYFLGAPKPTNHWPTALSDAFQRQRRAAALELAISRPDRMLFEVRARGRLQRQLLASAKGTS